MLVLSRKVGQQIVIDGRIRITVCRVDGQQVRLGFEAPPDVHIVRAELKPLANRPKGRGTAAAPVEAAPEGSAAAETAETDDIPPDPGRPEASAGPTSLQAVAASARSRRRGKRPLGGGWVNRRAR